MLGHDNILGEGDGMMRGEPRREVKGCELDGGAEQEWSLRVKKIVMEMELENLSRIRRSRSIR